MKWKRLYRESDGQVKTLPVELSLRDIKLIQNYLTKGKPLNDPSNKECMDVVIRILKGLVENADIEKLDIFISNLLHEKFGVEVDLDPYGENSAIELGENGLIPLSDCKDKDLTQGGKYGKLVKGGFWKSNGQLAEGYLDVDDFNEILKNLYIGRGIDTIQLKKDERNNVARVLLNFN